MNSIMRACSESFERIWFREPIAQRSPPTRRTYPSNKHLVSEEACVNFAAVANSEIVDVELTDLDSDKFSTTIARVTLREDGEHIIAYIFPTEQSVCLPSALDATKQCIMMARNILFVRDRSVDQKRIDDTVRMLQDGECVSWLGSSGTGISTEANIVMYHFMRHLGQEGWPDCVFHRIRGQIFEYRMKDGVLSTCTKNALTPADVSSYCVDVALAIEKGVWGSTKVPVIFLELGDCETYVNTDILTVFAAVSTRSEEVLRAQTKGGMHQFLVRPHSPAEIRMIGRVLLRVAREEVLVRLGLLPESALNGYAADDWHANAAPVGAAENGSDCPPEEAESASLLDPSDPTPAKMAQVDAEALTVLDKRVKTVGPVLRAVLHEPEAYSDYAECLPGNATQLFRALEIVTTDTMPDVAAYFVAHHPSTRPDRSMELHFVSDYAALLIARQVSSPAHMELLRRHRLDSNVVQAMAKIPFLLPDRRCSQHGLGTAEWHADPGYGAPLTARTKLRANANRPQYQLCACIDPMLGSACDRSASEMEEGVIYTTDAPGECLMKGWYDRGSVRTPTLLFPQSTARPLGQRPVAVASLKRIFETALLGRAENAACTITLLFLADWSEQATSGSMFVFDEYDDGQPVIADVAAAGNASDEGAEGENLEYPGELEVPGRSTLRREVTVKELQLLYPNLARRIRTFILRCDFYSRNGKFDLCTSRAAAGQGAALAPSVSGKRKHHGNEEAEL
jgi:hypothetical protein